MLLGDENELLEDESGLLGDESELLGDGIELLGDESELLKDVTELLLVESELLKDVAKPLVDRGELAVECGGDLGDALLGALGRDVVELHVIAGERDDMGDAGAHLPRPDHADLPEILRHHSLPT